MKQIVTTTLVTLALLLALPLDAAAQQTPAPGTPSSQALLSEALVPAPQAIEAYLQSLKTAKARFLQTAPNGSQLMGTFYLSRPGKLRFEYDNVEDFIVADGIFIYYYDSELGEQSNAPIGQTLANFLLRPNLKLSGDVTIVDMQRIGGLLRVTLRQTDEPGAGTLTLGFSEGPLALKKWTVVDAAAGTTEVELSELEQNIKLPESLFTYLKPKSAKPGYNR